MRHRRIQSPVLIATFADAGRLKLQGVPRLEFDGSPQVHLQRIDSIAAGGGARAFQTIRHWHDRLSPRISRKDRNCNQPRSDIAQFGELNAGHNGRKSRPIDHSTQLPLVRSGKCRKSWKGD